MILNFNKLEESDVSLTDWLVRNRYSVSRSTYRLTWIQFLFHQNQFRTFLRRILCRFLLQHYWEFWSIFITYFLFTNKILKPYVWITISRIINDFRWIPEFVQHIENGNSTLFTHLLKSIQWSHSLKPLFCKLWIESFSKL